MKNNLIYAACCFSSLFVNNVFAVNSLQTTNSVKSNDFFVQFDTGFAFSHHTSIKATQPDWNLTVQGYGNKLGNQALMGIGLGKNISPTTRISINATSYNTFNYNKYQDTVDAGTSRIRHFDLQHQNLMLNGEFTPRSKTFVISKQTFMLSPFIGGGIGIGRNNVVNFYTDSDAGSTYSEGLATAHYGLNWQGKIGITLQKLNSNLSIDIAYRYQDGGDFVGPDKVMNLNEYKNVSPWEGKLKASEILFSLRYSL